MMRIKTLRTRFALWTTALLLGILSVFGRFVYVNLSLNLHTSIDDSLSLSAVQTSANLNVENGRILPPEPITPEENGFQAFSERGLTLIVLDQNGNILQAAGHYQSAPAPIDRTQTDGSFTALHIAGDDDSIRVYTLPVLDNEQLVGWVQAMQSLSGVQDTLDHLLLALLLGGGTLSILAGFGGYFLAARALAPMDDITRTAAHISCVDLSARLDIPDTGDEVSRLAGTFNDMLTRLENGFKRERQFTADASHELRTPLAAMQTILSVMREGERPIIEYRAALDDLAEETDRLRGLVEDLLRLARGEGGQVHHPEPLDLSTLLIDIADSLRPLADSKGLVLTCDLPPTLPFSGDIDSLIRLFVNLLDNAIKYTERGGVTLSARREGKTLRIEVADTGIGIPPDHLPHIFERFYRVESARSSGGAGLGLAIARQIAQAHSGDIEVRSTCGAETTFTVILSE